MPKASLPVPTLRRPFAPVLGLALGLAVVGMDACAPQPDPTPKTAVAPTPAVAAAPAPACDCGRAGRGRSARGGKVAGQHAVVVRPAWTETIVTPAVFRTVWRTETAPGPAREVFIPARYRSVPERVLIPAHGEWRPSAGRPVTGPAARGYSAYAATGEVMCWVDVPAHYEIRLRGEVVSPAERRLVPGPVETRQVAEQVEVSPAASRQVQHPAVLRLVREAVVSPPRPAPPATPAVRPAPPPPIAPPCRAPAAPRPPHRLARPAPPAAPAEAAPYGERG